MRKGWLKIPGLQDGDRTLDEQIMAVRPALAECAGKSVLDLGCAEGLISLEFAKAGARRVLGLESIGDHLSVARQVCREFRAVIRFQQFDINKATDPLVHDIVLALGIVHKLTFPEQGLRFAARSARDLLLLRSGRGSVDGIIYGKFSRNTCDSAAVMREEGFVLEKVVDGPAGRDEPVEYWRKA